MIRGTVSKQAIKVAALVTVAVLLLPALAAASACWEAAQRSDSCCATQCANPKQPTHYSLKAGMDLSCCQVSSSKPAPRQTAIKQRETSPLVARVPSNLLVAALLPATVPAHFPFLPPRASSPSLNALFCVFLI